MAADSVKVGKSEVEKLMEELVLGDECMPSRCRKALHAFNSWVMCASPFASIHEARVRALEELNGSSVYLLGAFRALWPHWITKDDWSDPKAACERVLLRLRYDTSPGPASGLSALAAMGMYVIGGRKKAAVEKKHKRYSTQYVRSACKYHKDEPSFGRTGMCLSCYQRLMRIRAKGLVDDETPAAALDEILSIPMGQMHGKLRRGIMAILERYKT